MPRITNFEPTLASYLPATYELLMSSNLVIHPGVSRIVLHGSRGLAGGYRPTSDIDLSLIVDKLPSSARTDLKHVWIDVLETTRDHWQSPIELDLAIVFETSPCGLKCFDQTAWNSQLCTQGGVDCFGLYKVGKGFHGLVVNAGVQVKLMYPCLKIWGRTDYSRCSSDRA
ncbi:MAG TPA: nucleotidyltransferase domain-containing protein [Anaerolineales bacterium]|nr:nucleotidyltransferase domain-containing protein [Anaerolineales bacterium]